MDNDLAAIVVAIGITIFAFAGIIGVIARITYSIENVPLRVFLDGKEVYHGRSACISTESIGSSSRVDVKQGFSCLFPKEYFAGKNLVIETEQN